MYYTYYRVLLFSLVGSLKKILKAVNQKHPRLYVSIHKNNNDKYDVEYYQNQYNSNGDFEIISDQISLQSISNKKISQVNLHQINQHEYQSLVNLIRRQEKVVSIYLKKNKQDQFKIVSSSLDLMKNYEKKFSSWFSDNKEF